MVFMSSLVIVDVGYVDGGEEGSPVGGKGRREKPRVGG